MPAYHQDGDELLLFERELRLLFRGDCFLFWISYLFVVAEFELEFRILLVFFPTQTHLFATLI